MIRCVGTREDSRAADRRCVRSARGRTCLVRTPIDTAPLPSGTHTLFCATASPSGFVPKGFGGCCHSHRSRLTGPLLASQCVLGVSHRRYAARALSKDADRYDRAERRSNRQAKRLARKAKEARKELRSMRKKFSKLRLTLHMDTTFEDRLDCGSSRLTQCCIQSTAPRTGHRSLWSVHTYC